MTSDVVKPPLASTCDMAQLEHPPVWLGASAPMRRSTRFARLGSTARRFTCGRTRTSSTMSCHCGGTSRELIEHDEIRAMLLKLDKADFCLIEAGFVSIQTIRYWRQA
ncbi:hypothetical protein [Burkholderia ubonensis]|uniref:hypothetical protein n=2 Tax=Burkholderia ubonensis TaxID=101571 RepID=UPI0012FC12FD|nr:hypothetical protein [Burkholderia ubonensis]